MFSMLGQQPPELLQALYARLSRRYGAPGVCLLDFSGRWRCFEPRLWLPAWSAPSSMSCRRGTTLAEGLAEMEFRAEFAVGEDHDATLVLIDMIQRMPPDRAPSPALATPVLAIMVWSLAHPVAVMDRPHRA
jgi:hypothetical protein